MVDYGWVSRWREFEATVSIVPVVPESEKRINVQAHLLFLIIVQDSKLRDSVTHRGCESSFNSINLVEKVPYKNTQTPVYIKKMPILREASGLLQNTMYVIVLFYGDDSLLITFTYQLGTV